MESAFISGPFFFFNSPVGPVLRFRFLVSFLFKKKKPNKQNFQVLVFSQDYLQTKGQVEGDSVISSLLHNLGICQVTHIS